jgi:hypothetical protein
LYLGQVFLQLGHSIDNELQAFPNLKIFFTVRNMTTKIIRDWYLQDCLKQNTDLNLYYDINFESDRSIFFPSKIKNFLLDTKKTIEQNEHFYSKFYDFIKKERPLAYKELSLWISSEIKEQAIRQTEYAVKNGCKDANSIIERAEKKIRDANFTTDQNFYKIMGKFGVRDIFYLSQQDTKEYIKKLQELKGSNDARKRKNKFEKLEEFLDFFEVYRIDTGNHSGIIDYYEEENRCRGATAKFFKNHKDNIEVFFPTCKSLKDFLTLLKAEENYKEIICKLF